MNTALAIGILLCLRRTKQQLTAASIAAALDAPLSAVMDELGPLVRKGKVRRHHRADGVLRYSLVAGAAVSVATAITPHNMTPSIPRPRSAPKADAVLEVMTDEPMRSTAIAEACADRFTHKQVKSLLQILKRRGAVKKISGATSNTVWQRTMAAAHAGASQ